MRLNKPAAPRTTEPAASGDYIPLYEAAQRAYDDLYDVYGTVAYQIENGDVPAIITWFCYLLQPRLRIFGVLPPSAKHVVYSDRSKRDDGFHFAVDDKSVVAIDQFSSGRWEKLSVKRDDLMSVISSLKRGD